MKKGVIIGLVIVIVLIVGAYFIFMNKSANNYQNTPSQPSASSNEIAIQNFAFSPSTLTIKQGDTVKWTNQDSVPHHLASDSGIEINSATLANGDVYSHTFNTKGTFAYHCTIHTSMQGTIIVE